MTFFALFQAMRAPDQHVDRECPLVTQNEHVQAQATTGKNHVRMRCLGLPTPSARALLLG
jgi:hypothetical protein